MNELSFKKHVLSDAERKWLHAARERDFDPKSALVKLWDELPPDFEPERIDRRLYVNDMLTPIGIWHVNKADPIFELTERVALQVRAEIRANPKREQISSTEIASKLGISEREAGEALYVLGTLGRYFTGGGMVTGANEYRSIGLNDVSVHKAYLRYPGIEKALENYYVERGNIAQLTQGQVMWPRLEVASTPQTIDEKPRPDSQTSQPPTEHQVHRSVTWIGHTSREPL